MKTLIITAAICALPCLSPFPALADSISVEFDCAVADGVITSNVGDCTFSDGNSSVSASVSVSTSTRD